MSVPWAVTQPGVTTHSVWPVRSAWGGFVALSEIDSGMLVAGGAVVVTSGGRDSVVLGEGALSEVAV